MKRSEQTKALTFDFQGEFLHSSFDHDIDVRHHNGIKITEYHKEHYVSPISKGVVTEV